MPTSLPLKDVLVKATPKRADHKLLFGTALALAVAAGAVAYRLLPPGWAIPIAVTSVFLLAGGMALLAWQRRDSNTQDVNCWDVAGALTLIGICAAATIDPEQLMLIVETTGAAGHPDARISDR